MYLDSLYPSHKINRPVLFRNTSPLFTLISSNRTVSPLYSYLLAILSPMPAPDTQTVYHYLQSTNVCSPLAFSVRSSGSAKNPLLVAVR